jgi:hypothetical protein
MNFVSEDLHSLYYCIKGNKTDENNEEPEIPNRLLQLTPDSSVGEAGVPDNFVNLVASS